MAEAGYPGQTGETPIGIFVPAGTPPAIIDLLHRKVVALVATADVKAKLANIGFTPVADTPAEFAAFLKAEDDKWGKVIRDAGIKIE
jgi:tripartite-type tricarboxylate transporter receptor subunit TctC